MLWFSKRLEEMMLRHMALMRLNLVRTERFMANWQDIKNDIQALKDEMVKVYEAIDKWRAKVAECMAAEHVDPAELQAVHDDMSSVVAGLEEKLHADSM